ncbi:MAG: hypothetical protein O3C63_05040 [Cyanobacteria bacterium]|nr:hypothetical protein [Cyanobacteriota bacterium]MDA1020463.1 hypothetical protein [Cyanobacteriota bacterium]
MKRNKNKYVIFGLAIVIASFSVLGVSAENGITLGGGAQATAPGSIALGAQALASGFFSSAMGRGSKALTWSSVAIGNQSVANGLAAFAFGRDVIAEADGSMVLGSGYSDRDRSTSRQFYRADFINNKQYSLAVGFKSDKATLFVGPSNGKGTTGKVGIGTDEPTAKLDVAGAIKSNFLDTNGITANYIRATEHIVSKGDMAAQTIRSIVLSAIDAEFGTVRLTKTLSAPSMQGETLNVSSADINNVTAFSVDVDHEINTRHINAKTADVGFFTGRGLMVDVVSVQKQLRAKDIEADQAAISALGAKEAKIENLIAHKVKIDDQLSSKEASTEHLFVGSVDPIFLDAKSTALVAFETTVEGDVEETDDIVYLKKEIKKYEDLKISKNARDYGKKANGLKRTLEQLIAKQGGAKKAARVGVGTSKPQQTLHIAGAMRLEPLKQAPKEASMGDMYVDQSGALCVYLNKSWNYITGEGKCNE